MPKKIVITGASSKTGEAIFNFLRMETKHELVLISSNEKLISNLKDYETYNYSIDRLKEVRDILIYVKPDVIINTAGMNSIPDCEDDRKAAWSLNVAAAENLVKASRIIEAHTILFSSDQIFDGRKGPYIEEDKANPINYFGKTKLAIENIAMPGNSKCTIIRTNNIFGHTSYGKPNFIIDILDKLNLQTPSVYSQFEYINPALTLDIAQAVAKIIDKERTGIYNVGSSDIKSRYEIARIIARIFNHDAELIKIPESELKDKNPVQKKYGLVTLKTETDLNVKMSGITDSLVAFKTLLFGKKVIKLI